LRIRIDDYRLTCFLRVQSECRWFSQNKFFHEWLFFSDGLFLSWAGVKPGPPWAWVWQIGELIPLCHCDSLFYDASRTKFGHQAFGNRLAHFINHLEFTFHVNMEWSLKRLLNIFFLKNLTSKRSSLKLSKKCEEFIFFARLENCLTKQNFCWKLSQFARWLC